MFVVAKLTQLAKIRSICREIDPDAFVIVHDVNDVFGRGFTLKPSGPNCPRPKLPAEVIKEIKEHAAERKQHSHEQEEK